MGTRSIIQFNSKEHDLTLVLYKHWDGYPSDTLNMINESSNAKTFEQLLDACAAYYTGEIDPDNKHQQIRTLDTMMEYCGPFNEVIPNGHGQHGDLEYFYIVDVDNKNIDVYGDNYGCESDHYCNGRISPFKELDSYTNDYQLRARTGITETLISLGLKGWTINILESNKKAV